MFRKIVTSFLLVLVGIVGFFGNVEFKSSANSIEINKLSFANVGYADCADGTKVGPCPEAKNTQDEEMRKMMNNIIAGLNLILGFLTVIVSPAIVLAGWLMSPDWTSGDVFGLRPMIHSLWITISNIIYFVYAVLLIFIALATIFNSDHYGYKALLPKLAIGILMVPLTWWMVQFIISVASYVTVSVITIPMSTVDKYMGGADKNNSLIYRNIIPKLMVYENDKTVYKSNDTDKGTASDDAQANAFCNNDDGTKCISPKDFMEKGGGSFSPLMVYAFGIFKFQNIGQIGGTIDGIKSVGQLVNQAFIGALMFLIFGLLVLALIFMLAMRAIRLWFYAIFSPLFTLQYVIGDSIFGENKDTFSIKEFIGLAFAPALAGLALSFGLVIISVMVTPASTSKSVSCPTENSCKLRLFGNDENYVETKVTGEGDKRTSQTSVSIGGVTYRFQGSIVSAGEGKSSTAVAKEALSLTGGIFGTIIIDIIALIFIWVAFMAVKGVSNAVKAAIDPFQKMGEKIGNMGMALPKYTPIPGIGLSAKGMEKVVEKAQYTLDAAHEKETNEQIAKKFPGLAPKNMATVEDINSVREAMKTYGQNNPEEVLKKIGNIQSGGRANDETSIKLFLEKTSPELKTMDKEKIRTTLRDKGVEKDRADEVIELIFEPEKLNGEKRIRAMSTIGSKFGTNAVNSSNSTGFTGKAATSPGGLMQLEFNGITISAKPDKDSITKAIGSQLTEFKDQHKVDVKTLASMLSKAGVVATDKSEDMAKDILSSVSSIKKDDAKKDDSKK